jgi:hypothetical protein
VQHGQTFVGFWLVGLTLKKPAHCGQVRLVNPSESWGIVIVKGAFDTAGTIARLSERSGQVGAEFFASDAHAMLPTWSNSTLTSSPT